MRLPLLNARRPAKTPAAPPDLRLYAIGDIHGRADLLDLMARAIAEDLARAPIEALTIFLGDYVDRGPASAAVLERLQAADFPTKFVALKGNHEHFMLEALEDASHYDSWRKYGGLETLVSYGVDVAEVMRGKGFEKARAELAARTPASHRDFLADLPTSFSCGDYFFCHAGIRPGVPLHAQSDQDLLWIREDFLRSTKPAEKVVVHGHTPVADAELLPHRINLDTGAYISGKLSCLVLEGQQQRLLTAAL